MECKDLCGRGGDGVGGGKDMGEGGVERKVQEPCAGGEGERDGYGGGRGRGSGTEGTRTLCRRGGWSEEREGYGGGQWNGRYKRRGGDGVRRDMEEWNGRYKNPVQEGRDGVRRGKDMGEGGGSGTDGP